MNTDNDFNRDQMYADMLANVLVILCILGAILYFLPEILNYLNT